MKELNLALLSAAVKKCKIAVQMYIKKLDVGYEVPGKSREFFDQVNQKLIDLEEFING
jgi:hypothetical protein